MVGGARRSRNTHVTLGLLLAGALLAPSEASAGITDLVADALEVTQATQDLNNSVGLVRGKRTFVRFHVHATTPGIHSATARLCAPFLFSEICLSPLNPKGRINVPMTPNRAAINDSFLFELPSLLTQFDVLSLRAEVNPPSSSALRLSLTQAVETNTANNTISRTANFRTVPMQQIISVSVPYTLNGTTYSPGIEHHFGLHTWMKAAYPIPDLITTASEMVPGYTGTRAFDAKGNPYLSHPDCETVNARLWLGAAFDALFGAPWQYPRKYYGMVSYDGAFMRGCVTEIPDLMGSGPTGVPDAFHWDTDGIYGDWYGGHELAHAYGREHANFCDAEGGPSYPYPSGRISPTLSGPTSIYGIRPDVPNAAQGWEIYPPWWTDLMTYCDNEWMSDFTYEGLMDEILGYDLGDAFQNGGGPVGGPLEDGPGALLVAAVYDPSTSSARMLQPIALPGLWTVRDADSAFSIKQRRAFSRETPVLSLPAIPMGPGAPQPGGSAEHTETLLIRGLVPLETDTNRIELEGPNGEILASISAGLSPPSVAVTGPATGSSVSGDAVTVSWNASDPDGDALRSSVEYSPDNGQTWTMVAHDVVASSVSVPRENLIASDRARFRVRTTDGIHASDAVSGLVRVVNSQPTVEITTPATGTTVATGQTLPLAADAVDLDGGTMTGSLVRWSSDRDGVLGEGAELSVTGLSPGAHTITVVADDGMGGVATDTVAVTVVADIVDLPVVRDVLTAGPSSVLLDPAAGLNRHEIRIANLNPDDPLRVWVVVSRHRWLRVGTLADNVAVPGVAVSNDISVEAGVAPGVLTISVGTTSGMQPGTYRAELVVTSPGMDPLTIPVTLKLGST